MGRHSTAPTRHDPSRRAGGVLLGAVALAVGSLGSAGTTNASCLSWSGFGNGNGCNTTNIGDLAVVLGTGTATAKGGLNTAIVVNGGTADAAANGNLNIAFAANGGSSSAKNGGGLNLLAALGPGSIATTPTGTGNIAVAGSNSTSTASGLYNVALANAPGAIGGMQLARQETTRATSIATGNLNIAITRGQGSDATADGGVFAQPIRLINLGRNTAITIGNNSHSKAGNGTPDKLSENFKFAAALGNDKTASNPAAAATARKSAAAKPAASSDDSSDARSTAGRGKAGTD